MCSIMIYFGFDPFLSMRSTRRRIIDRYASVLAIDIRKCLDRSRLISIGVHKYRRSMSRHQTRHFGFSRLKNQGQAKLPKCPDEESFSFLDLVLLQVSFGREDHLVFSYSRIGLARTRRSMSSTDNRSMLAKVYRSTCMPSGTRSNKEKDLLFSDDPAHLERTIHRGQHSTSLEATTSSSIDTYNQPSTDTRLSSSIDPSRSTTIDTTPCTSINNVSLKMDENGNLYDQVDHLRNAPVVRNENLEEGDFEIESSMSLGGSQWCRLMSMNSHRSTDHDEDRWTDYSKHRSTSSADSTECNTHPHPPSPFYEKIDRSVNLTIDRQSESDVDRHNTPPIDRQTPLTYRVRLPSIDNDYINALRPPIKPLANPPEPTPNPLNSSTEPVQEEQESEGRRLRKRKEKIPKNLKREANDKEMDAYFTHRLWMFFRETKVTEEDIRRMFHQVRGKMKHRITLTKKSDLGKFAIPCIVKGVEFPHSMCDTGASVSILPRVMADQLELGFIGACHCGAEYESEYETAYSESIDTPLSPSIDSNVSMVTDDHNNTSLDRGHDDYSIGSWADSGFHESFAVDTDERLEIHNFTNTFPTSFDDVHSTSVDTHPRPAKQPLTSIATPKGTSIDIRTAAKIQEQENIPSLTRDPDGNARSMDGRILQVSREDIADILQVTNGPDNLFSQQRGTPDVILTDPNNNA
ncbi:hypothetical protein IGI04_006498 [Brassica rapa subsp. trilocularis]|uniref:Peptidase A2 domain-containing protein n=1 Tax=Brassica rapa subsp. trilocularis TaxID=1813537 RepID=A0ABQ7NH56_BRACM|nr:hypothetical protein IGI04_006498 [Brassica rapa subsp. trilocularis]